TGQLILRCQQPRKTSTAAPATPVATRLRGTFQRDFFSSAIRTGPQSLSGTRARPPAPQLEFHSSSLRQRPLTKGQARRAVRHKEKYCDEIQSLVTYNVGFPGRSRHRGGLCSRRKRLRSRGLTVQ